MKPSVPAEASPAPRATSRVCTARTPRVEREYGGRVALVVGAGAGIGRALAVELARRGATLVAADRERAALQEVVAEAWALDAGASLELVDVRDAESVQAMVESVMLRHGRVDLFIHAANTVGDADDASLEHWRAAVDINLMGAVHGVTSIYPLMKRAGRGHIVHVAPLPALEPTAASVACSATQRAVVALSETLRIDAAPHGVNVSAVHAGRPSLAPPLGAFDESFEPSATRPASPPGVLALEASARDILEGVRKNRAVITPGAVAPLARLARLLRDAWRLATGHVGMPLDTTPLPVLAMAHEASRARAFSGGTESSQRWQHRDVP